MINNIRCLPGDRVTRVSVFLLLVSTVPVFAQDELSNEEYPFRYKSKKSVLYYKFHYREGKRYLSGLIQTSKTDEPVSDVNIQVKDFPIGTVSDLRGEFSIMLPRKTGVVTFVKVGGDRFELRYEFSATPVFTHD